MNWLKQNWILVIVILVSIATIGWLIFYDRGAIYLYAWERPEDFYFLDGSSNTTVVFYAGDVVIKDGKAVANFRRNPLHIPDDINSFPLVRIDSFDSSDNLLANKDKITNFIIQICALYEECQVDFEARTSEYDFYIELMKDVRTAIPDIKISATSLASWCSGRGFLDELSVDAATPMLYRMGRDGPAIKKGEVGSWFLSNSKCNDTIALSTDEFDFDHRRYSKGKSIYIFNPKPWNEDSYKEARIFLGI